MPWPWNRKKGKKESEADGDGVFQAKTVLGRLEEEGFKPLIKADVLESRIKEVRATLAKQLEEGDLGDFVDNIYNLFFTVGSAWFRSMENKFLARKVNAFLKRYNMERDIDSKVALRILVREGLYLVNLAFAGLDVTPLTPIIINAGPRRRGRENMTGEPDF